MRRTFVALVWLAVTSAQSTNDTVVLDAPRTSDVLANITAMYPLPTVNTTGNGLNLTDIQGDILIGMKKKLELFYFFKINNARAFKNKLRNNVVPRITSTFQLLNYTTQPQVMLNIGFSQAGLFALDSSFAISDPVFANGQLADAPELGDVTDNWVSAFKGTNVHGIFLMASDTQLKINAQVHYLEQLFSSDITKLYSIQGSIRPPPYEGHEMFGFMDGIAQPAVNGFNLNPAPGQETIDPGTILLGEIGDKGNGGTGRPAWQKSGSLLAFRQLKQLVPEFNKFLMDNAPAVPGLTQQERVDLFGSSGDLSPLRDNITLSLSPANNNFNYSHPGFDIKSDQTHCPFAAHIRKTRPRGDFNDLGISAKANSILRAGIPYGPEVTTAEANSNVSSNVVNMERGLAFVSYQSVMEDGFKFLSHTWANNVNFPPAKNFSDVGFDPIIGQNAGQPRHMIGYDPTDASKDLTINKDFVVARGGEYFFSPSISALAGPLSA